MKQAILIITYKNIGHVKEIINCFDEDYLFYIHVDKKSNILKEETADLLNDKRVALLQKKYRVYWGGTNYLKTVLFLIKEALKNTELEYMHLISGHDFPIKNCDYIKDFIKKNRGKEFLEFSELPDRGWNTFEWSNGGEERLQYYYFYDLFNAKLKRRHRVILKLVRWQSKFGLQRKLSPRFPKLYGGSAFWTLSRQCLEYISKYNYDNPSYLKRFSFTYVPDELFFQTIIMNSPFKEDVLNDNLRYIIWENRNGNNPANLDQRDFENILHSNKLFARKFEYPVSQPLLVQLKNYLFQQKL